MCGCLLIREISQLIKKGNGRRRADFLKGDDLPIIGLLPYPFGLTNSFCKQPRALAFNIIRMSILQLLMHTNNNDDDNDAVCVL